MAMIKALAALPFLGILVGSVFLNRVTPLVLGLPWALLAALTIGMVVVFVVVSFAIARLVELSATPSQLRGAQQ